VSRCNKQRRATSGKEPVYDEGTILGLDVHAETIAAAVAEPDGEVRSLGMIPNWQESIRKLVTKFGPPEQLRTCYEAGPTGYVLYWQLTALGVKCEVVVPSLVPVKAGDRVKTDRRDARKLAHSYRAGDLTPVWVPDAAQGSVARSGVAIVKTMAGAKHQAGLTMFRGEAIQQFHNRLSRLLE